MSLTGLQVPFRIREGSLHRVVLKHVSDSVFGVCEALPTARNNAAARGELMNVEERSVSSHTTQISVMEFVTTL
jgi:hypothetical protein